LIIYNFFPLYLFAPWILPPSVAEFSIANTERCTNELPGVGIFTIALLIADIKILSIHEESYVAAIGQLI
jgi:hypothetical protein